VSRSASGRWAVVTGPSSGIGMVFAQELARWGYPVLAVARRRERLEQLESELTASGGHLEPLVADLQTSDALPAAPIGRARRRRAARERCRRRHGGGLPLRRARGAARGDPVERGRAGGPDPPGAAGHGPPRPWGDHQPLVPRRLPTLPPLRRVCRHQGVRPELHGGVGRGVARDRGAGPGGLPWRAEDRDGCLRAKRGAPRPVRLAR
jgi:hypothetical protein